MASARWCCAVSLSRRVCCTRRPIVFAVRAGASGTRNSNDMRARLWALLEAEGRDGQRLRVCERIAVDADDEGLRRCANGEAFQPSWFWASRKGRGQAVTVVEAMMRKLLGSLLMRAGAGAGRRPCYWTLAWHAPAPQRRANGRPRCTSAPFERDTSVSTAAAAGLRNACALPAASTVAVIAGWRRKAEGAHCPVALAAPAASTGCAGPAALLDRRSAPERRSARRRPLRRHRCASALASARPASPGTPS